MQMVDRDVDGELEDLRRGVEAVAEWIEQARDSNEGNGVVQGVLESCLRRLRAECGHFPRQPKEPPKPATKLTPEEVIERCRAVCTCPKSGPSAPTAGMRLRPAIIVGHGPGCPAVAVLAANR